MARLRQATDPAPRAAPATSAGGIVVRFGPQGPEIVIGRRWRPKDGVTWTLPKGTPEAGESVEATALREVAEETGLEVRIVAPAGSIEQRYVMME